MSPWIEGGTFVRVTTPTSIAIDGMVLAQASGIVIKTATPTMPKALGLIDVFFFDGPACGKEMRLPSWYVTPDRSEEQADGAAK